MAIAPAGTRLIRGGRGSSLFKIQNILVLEGPAGTAPLGSNKSWVLKDSGTTEAALLACRKNLALVATKHSIPVGSRAPKCLECRAMRRGFQVEAQLWVRPVQRVHETS